MSTRSLSKIHEVIFNNPEGVARGIEYYWVYILVKARRRHVLIFLYPGLLICKSQQCYRSNLQGNIYIFLGKYLYFPANWYHVSGTGIALWFPFICTASQDTKVYTYPLAHKHEHWHAPWHYHRKIMHLSGKWLVEQTCWYDVYTIYVYIKTHAASIVELIRKLWKYKMCSATITHAIKSLGTRIGSI